MWLKLTPVEIKSYMSFLLSQPGAPQYVLIRLTVCYSVRHINEMSILYIERQCLSIIIIIIII